MQEIYGTMKGPILQIMNIELKKFQVKDVQHIFNKITEVNFPNQHLSRNLIGLQF